MSTLTKLHLDFLAALDHAMFLSYRKGPHTQECYGTRVQQAQAWRRFEDLKHELNSRLQAIQREETDTINDPYAAMAAAATGD